MSANMPTVLVLTYTCHVSLLVYAFAGLEANAKAAMISHELAHVWRMLYSEEVLQSVTCNAHMHL